MVADEDRKFLVELLSGLKEADLMSLASTSTSGKLSPKDKEGKVKILLESLVLCRYEGYNIPS